jgi:hypothetical protein
MDIDINDLGKGIYLKITHIVTEIIRKVFQ